MSGGGDRGGSDAGRDAGADDAPVSDAEVDGADATESGYRRDDYWREEARAGAGPADVPEPPQGYAFESPEQRARADEEAGDRNDAGEASGDGPSDDDAGPGPGAEQGNAGGRDDARIVDD